MLEKEPYICYLNNNNMLKVNVKQSGEAVSVEKVQFSRRKLSPEQVAERKEWAKRYRKTCPKPTKEEIAYRKEARAYRKQEIIRNKEEIAERKILKAMIKKELEVLNFMLKTDILYHHHGYSESMKKEITEQIAELKETSKPKVYHPYIWNYRGEGHNYMFRSELECLFHSSEFNTTHDVPLDGTYIFEKYDSGQRGSGSFSGLTVRKVEEKPYIPKVNPGGIMPVTAF